MTTKNDAKTDKKPSPVLTSSTDEIKHLNEALLRLMKESEHHLKVRRETEYVIHKGSPTNSELPILSAVKNLIKEIEELKEENRKLKEKVKSLSKL